MSSRLSDAWLSSTLLLLICAFVVELDEGTSWVQKFSVLLKIFELFGRQLLWPLSLSSGVVKVCEQKCRNIFFVADCNSSLLRSKKAKNKFET